MSWTKLDARKINYVENFEARKGEPIHTIKSNYEIEEERKNAALDKLEQRAKDSRLRAKNNINSNGQYHL